MLKLINLKLESKKDLKLYIITIKIKLAQDKFLWLYTKRAIFNSHAVILLINQNNKFKYKFICMQFYSRK